MTETGRAIIRGKRNCVFMREANEFQLIVTYDESWQTRHVTPQKNEYIFAFYLSPSAALLWEMLKDCPTEQVLRSRLAERFGFSGKAAEETLSRFLKTLHDYALIEYAPTSKATGPSPYEPVLGRDAVSTSDVTFDGERIVIKPVVLKQEVSCQTSPDYGYLENCMCYSEG